jgi:hypothetical protein
METTAEVITETVKAYAAAMAAKINMRKEEALDWRTTWDNELMMLATSEGINIGRVQVEYGEKRTYKFELFTLNGVELLEKRYGITETGWEHMPTVTNKLSADTDIYTGW